MVYLIMFEVFVYLDYCEKNGYLCLVIIMCFEDGQVVEGLIYIVVEDNEVFVGLVSELEIVCQIVGVVGFSGCNSEYLFKLVQVLCDLGVEDCYVFVIE